MIFQVDALLDLWSSTPPQDAETAREEFRKFYCDQVVVNGEHLDVDDLVERARRLHQALSDTERTVLDMCGDEVKVAVAFQLVGRHTGPLLTAAGELPPTGRRISFRVVDILTLDAGKITSITMVAGEPTDASPVPDG